MASKHNVLSAWNEEWSWRRLDLLDMIFLGWIAAAFIVVAAVNLYIRFFGHQSRKTKQSQSSETATSNGKSWPQQWQSGNTTTISNHGGGESCSWINDAALWLYSRGNYCIDLEDRILRSLNNRSLQHAQQDYSIKFERLQYDKNAFKFVQITTANISEDNFNILASVECCKVVLKVSTSNQSDHGFQVSDSYEVELSRLRGTLKVACQSNTEGITATLCFSSPPEIQFQVLAASSQNEADKRKVESAVRECIGSLQTTIVVSAYGGQGQQMMHDDRFFASSANSTPAMQQVAASTTEHVTKAVVSESAIVENLALVDSRNVTPTPDSNAFCLHSEPSSDEFSFQRLNAIARESVFNSSSGYHYLENSRDVHQYDNSLSKNPTTTGTRTNSEYADIDSIRERKNKKSTLAAAAAAASTRQEPPQELAETKQLLAFNGDHHLANVSAPLVPPPPIPAPMMSRQVERVMSSSTDTGDMDSRRSSQALSDCSTLCSSVHSALVDLSNTALPPIPDPVTGGGAHSSSSGLLMDLPGASGGIKRQKSASKHRKSSSSKASTLPANAVAPTAGSATEGSSASGNTRPPSSASGRIPIEIREMTLLSQPNDFEIHYRQSAAIPVLDRRHTVARSSSSPMAMSSQRPKDKTLLVKVIKANGLGDKNNTAVHPYCVILLDQPPQKHVTAVIRNTVNPFWDEHFLLTVDDSSRQIRFEVFHNDRPGSDELLGRAVVTVAEIRRNSGSRQFNSSSRQIVPLTGRSGSKSTSGSITIECAYLDQTEMSPLVNMPAEANSLARRPSDSISRSIALENSMGAPTPRPSSVASNQLSAHEGALAPFQGGSTQHSPQVRGVLVSPTVTVSSPDHSAGVGRHGGMDEISIPVIRTPENRSSAERDRYSTSTATSTGSVHDGKKQKTSLADVLRKRFGRPKKRTQSADRFTQSMRESSLLRPPEPHLGGGQNLTTGDKAVAVSSERLGRKERSGSFGSSFKKLFGSKKKKDSAAASRENSVSRSASAQPLADVSISSQDRDNSQQQARGSSSYQDSSGASYSRNTLAYSDPYSRQYLDHQDQVNGGDHFDDGNENMNSFNDDQPFDDSYRTASSRAGDISSSANTRGRQRNSYGEMTGGGYAYSTSVPANNHHLHMY